MVDVSIDSLFTHNAYDIESPDGSVEFHGSFLIDKNNVVRGQMVIDLPLGRNVDEMLRMIDALQFNEEHSEVCPARWNKDSRGMSASPNMAAAYVVEETDKL